jgi:hypothetical protein
VARRRRILIHTSDERPAGRRVLRSFLASRFEFVHGRQVEFIRTLPARELIFAPFQEFAPWTPLPLTRE